MNKQWSVLLVTILTSALLWGCGSSGGSGGSADVITLEEVERAGITNCAQCHTTQNEDWLEGRHANIAIGNDPSPTGPHDKESSCQPCHNLTLDAVNMPVAYGVSIRDVVSCEACHGGGSAHRGVGPIPVPVPGVDECAQCHAEVDDATGDYVPVSVSFGAHPDSANVVVDYLVSGHADSPRDLSNRSGTFGCNRCHSDEGAKLYRGLNTIADIEADALPLGEENLTSIQCRTCHDSHDTGGNKLLLDGTAGFSAQYNTCNHCHAGDNTDLIWHTDHTDGGIELLDRQINDTHYDDPATPGVIEGYIIRTAAETSCSDCHNVHSADLTIQQQWARSGHAAGILEFKEQAGVNSGFAAETPEYSAAVIEAGLTDAEAPAFIHGGWSTSCQRCHTATGAKNYLADPGTYDANANDFSHFGSGAQDGSQDELLYCWGCHSDATTGELIEPATVPFPAGVNLSLDDGSNVCMACHQGRESGDSVAAVTPTGTEVNLSFINRHYYAAAAIMFGSEAVAGYQYAGKTYDGATAWPAAHGDLNSCVGCHMGEGEADHTFEANLATCQNCHASATSFEEIGIDFKDADFDGDAVAEGYQGEIDTLTAALLNEIMTYAPANGLDMVVYYSGSYPYWFVDTDGDNIADAGEANYGNRYQDFNAALLRAAYNFHSAQDPCGDIHNHRYVIQTLIDSIENLGGDISAYTRP